MSADFDVAAIPLTGIQAIEASAGSGKTHALVSLYLRAVLEQGLGVDAIVAVTFTDAATAELGERIVQRLDAVRRWLDEGRALAGSDAALLETIVDRAGSLALVRARLGAALIQLDRIAVMTLHGYARRALAEEAWQAFDLRERRPVDGTRSRAEAARDGLRRWDQEDPARALRLRQSFRSAEALARLAAELTALRASRVVPADPEQAYRQALAQVAQRGEALAVDLDAERVAELQSLLADHPALLHNARDGYPAPRVQAMCAALLQWRQRPDEPLPELVDALHPRAIAAARRAKPPPGADPTHPLLDRLAPLIEASAAARRLAIAADLWSAWQAIEEGAARREDIQGEASHDRVIQALYQQLLGADGQVLAARLGARHRLLLVDEFQDTDPLQFAILARVRAGAAGGLIVIGDPKQAIYGFRGGDVYAWQRALAGADKCYRLDTNWRSAPNLVAAINDLFTDADPFELDFVRYAAVRPTARVDGTTLQDPACSAPFVFLCGTQAVPDAAQIVATELQRLLVAADVRLAGRRVRPADCAVLVRRHQEALLVAAALEALGIPSARVASDALLEGQAMREWRRWLALLAEPGHPGHLRAVLGGFAFGWDAAAIAALDVQLEAETAERERWRAWRDLLFESGLAAVVDAICGAVAASLLAREGGAALLDALRQLGAWLAVDAAHVRDPAVLLSRLDRARLRSQTAEVAVNGAAPVAVDAVRVMTIHAAKGLEFPIVFVVGLDRSAPNSTARYARIHDAQGEVVLDLGSEDIEVNRVAAAAEARRETMRLTYVALTRAVHRCYVVITPTAGSRSRDAPLARLLGVDVSDRSRGADWDTAIDARIAAAGECFGRRVADAGALPVERAPAEDAAPAVRVLRRLPGVARQYLSYSALARREEDFDARDHDRAALPPGGRSGALAARQFGDCFHELIAALHADGSQAALEVALARMAAARDLDPATVEELQRLVRAASEVQLSSGARWCELAPSARSTELAFAYRVGPGSAARVAQALDEAGWGRLAARLAEGLAARPGLMRGAIDAVYFHAGRWHLLDWKTHRSAADPALPLERLMEEHTYHLQALIYQVALHRHLQARLRSRYCPQTDLGHADYVFVRRALVPNAPAVVVAGVAASVIVAVDAAFEAMA